MDKVATLDSRALVSVRGPEARSFLHNLLTQDIETLSPGDVRFAALLSPPGRLLFDLFLIGQDEGVLLDVARQDREALIQRLTLYRLRSQIEITTDDRQVQASWPQVSPHFVRDPRTALMGGRAYGRQVSPTASEGDYDAHRLGLGIPDVGRDCGTDRTYPIEANFDLLNGIDFGKGCFIGQETASRMKRRGGIRKRMLALDFDGLAPGPGTEVVSNDLRVGEVLSGQGRRAMALLRLDRLDGPLTADGRHARVHYPPWWPGQVGDHET